MLVFDRVSERLIRNAHYCRATNAPPANGDSLEEGGCSVEKKGMRCRESCGIANVDGPA